MKNFIKSFGILFSVLFLNASAHKSIWPNSNYLHNEDKSTCIQFQFLKGSNRVAEFRKIAETIFKCNSIENNITYSTSDIGFFELTKILGDYSYKTNENQAVYLLNANETSRVIISENTTTGMVSCLIKDN